MLTLVKDTSVKFIDENSSLVEALLKDGWSIEGQLPAEEAPKKRGPKPKVQE